MIELSLVHQLEAGPDMRIWFEIDTSKGSPTLWIRQANNLGGGSTGENWQASGEGIRVEPRLIPRLRRGLELAEQRLAGANSSCAE
jgi:hypothetical protein